MLLEALIKKIQGKCLALRLTHSKCSVNTSDCYSRCSETKDWGLHLVTAPTHHPIKTVSRENTGRDREGRGGGGG